MRLVSGDSSNQQRRAHNRRLFDPRPVVVVVAALLMRAVYNLALHPDGHPPWSFIIDEREYFAAAHVLAEGRGFSFFDTALWVRPPLYVALLGAIMLVAGTGYLPVLLVQSALSAATLLPIGWLARNIAGHRAALWTVVLGALYLPFTLFAGLLLSETLFLFLFVLALAALLRTRQLLAQAVPDQHSERPSARVRQRLHLYAWAVLAGALLGLGVLTRANALAFVPLSVLWLVWGAGRSRGAAGQTDDAAGYGKRGGLRLRTSVATASLVLAACIAALLPWVLRNYRAYGVATIDTTAGYNLWLGSVGVRDEQRLQADLRAIPDHAGRQAFALAHAWENIAADPARFIARGVKEMLDLWRPLFSAEERQVAGYTLGRVPAWHLAALLAFDDLLYTAILLLALAGMVLWPPHPFKWLTLLWVLVWVGMAFVFFAVTRFRLPVVAVLLPWAGVGVSMLSTRWKMARVWGGLSRWRRGAVLAGAGAILLVVVPAISVGDIFVGIQRWGQQVPFRRAEGLLREGRPAEAIRLYRQANPDLLDTRYGLAAAYLQTGQIQQALALLRADEPPDRFEPFIIRGEAARLSGDLNSARSFFNARQVQVAGEEALEWAWDHLAPPPVDSIQPGSGLDVGYIRGFYAPETGEGGTQFRWSGPHAEVRGLKMLASSAGRAGINITLSGWRPAGLPAARVVVSIGDRSTGFQPTPGVGWQAYTVEVEAGTATNTNAERFSVDSDAFVPGGQDPRLLGVRVSMVGLR